MTDQPERSLALDPTQSFIVQAPAGSGKTELLIQRFLILLARVSEPEEVLAITFTRKAANEMRDRILSALNKAAYSASPEEAHAAKTWRLAKQVLVRDRLFSWSLLNNPTRLCIQTIDALAHQIVRQTPLLSEFSPITEIAEDTQWLYQLAIRQLLSREHMPEDFRASLKVVLLHLNNDGNKLEALLKMMLAKREQWLEHIVSPKNRHHLESALKRVNQALLLQCERTFPSAYQEALLTLLRFAQQQGGKGLKHLHWDQNLHPAIEDPVIEDRNRWLAISNFLLTKTFNFRETVNHALGFPPENLADNAHERAQFKEMKIRFRSLIEALKPFESFRMALENLAKAPSLTYSQAQWETLSALIMILKHVLAELRLVFFEKKKVDFVEMMLAALNALGTADQPSELGLILDCKIQHLLMDEFQDTSWMQFQLIERLLSGWQPGDGRTLFLVGDPMQSIYRFRQAEVSLFLRVKEKGIANIRLNSIQLTVNFRSEAGLLDWINEQFSHIFPKEENIDLGAVSFYPSTAVKKTSHPKSLYTHRVTSRDEGDRLCKLIQEKWKCDPTHRIAILVRSRHHLETIIPVLSKTGLPFHAVEIAALKEQPVIRDLYALARILLSPLDQLAWFVTLRAPWCGLCLEDVQRLVDQEQDQDFLSLLSRIPETLSEDGQKRFLLVGNAIKSAIADRGRERFSYQIKSLWITIKGLLCYADIESQQYAQNFFDLLDSIELEMGWVDLNRLDERLGQLYAGGGEEIDARLQLMTIHKAKGLEFDSVIIPGVERKPKNDRSPILRWLEQVSGEEKSDLLLAPIKACVNEENSIYQYLADIEKLKQQYEVARLLYVAATRAKACLHWFMTSQDISNHQVPSGSLLSLLTSLDFSNDSKAKASHEETAKFSQQPLRLRRLKSSYFKVDPDEGRATHPVPEALDCSTHKIDTFYEKLGIVIHRLLEQMGRQFELHETWLGNDMLWKKWLIQEGFLPSQYESALKKIRQVYDNVRKDPIGKWILDATHENSCYELTVTSKREAVKETQPAYFEAYHHIRIDRTFIDQNGCRWIIDYKSNVPAPNQSLLDFFKSMKSQYYEQLRQYGRAMSHLGNHPICLGLYFPLIPAWHTWQWKDEPFLPAE